MFALGKKLKMTQVWKEGTVTPVTVVEVQPNTISLLRTADKDGYVAVQVSLGKTKREFRVDDASAFTAGEAVTASAFSEGDMVRVTGTTKGRGFQGVVKRHGFGGGPKTHGQKNRHRAPGSIGSTAPQRVWPGRRMAGRMGSDRVTLKALRVVGVDPEKNLVFISGAIPGSRGGLIELRKVGVK